VPATPPPIAPPTPVPATPAPIAPPTAPVAPPTPVPEIPVPTPPPSAEPTPAPSPAPTTACIIDVAIDGCFNFTPPFDNNCQGRPVSLTFRYNGGDCSQSNNLQDRQKFDCFDLEPPTGSGPPPTIAGEEAYVLATTFGGNDIYFEGFVPIGETFTLNEDQLYDKLAADMNITFYDPKGSTDPATILVAENIMQTMFVHLSCSQPLYLLDRFGAAQVTEWTEDSGRVVTTAIETTTGDLILSLNTTGIDGGEGAVVLTEMNIISNTEGFINKTDEVAGTILEPGDVILLAPINVTLDLSKRTRYTFFTTVVGTSLDGSVECNGFDFHECIVGNALPPAFPTLAPTPSPTVTPYPTPDPETTECTAEALINCVVADPFISNCEDLIAPTDLTCTIGAEMITFTFEVTTNKCDGTPGCVDESDEAIPDEIYMLITDCEGSRFYETDANVGDTILVDSRGNFLCPEILITIETFNFNEAEEANEGVLLQTLTLPTTCTDEPPYTLNEDYGALRLVQYNSDLDGIRSEFATIQMSYVVSNDGPFGASITSAPLTSAFSGEQDIGSFVVGPRSQSQIFTETSTINLLTSAGMTFDFSLSIEGSSTTDAAPVCASDTTYSFTI
jgi:hypothetical protein